MSCNCNNIFPDCDMRRWESCDAVQLANADNYYTKGQVDDKLDELVISGGGVTSGEVVSMISESLSGYNPTDNFRTINGNSIIGTGDIHISTGGTYNGGNGVVVSDRSIYTNLPARGASYIDYDNTNMHYPNGLIIDDWSTKGKMVIGRYNDDDDYIEGEYDERYYPYFAIGDGMDENNRSNIFTIFSNGKIKIKDDDNEKILQDWMRETDGWIYEDLFNSVVGNDIRFASVSGNLQEATGTININNGQEDTGNGKNRIYFKYIWESGTTVPENIIITPYAEDLQFGRHMDATLSGFTIDGYNPTNNFKTINGESIIGQGNIVISGGSSVNSNIQEVTQAEYDEMEQGGTLDPDTLYIITDAPASDLSEYWTSAQTQAAIEAATSGGVETSAITALESSLSAHTANTGIHTSQAEKDAWNAKLDASAYTQVIIDQTLNRESTNAVSNEAVVNGLDSVTDMLVGKLQAEYLSADEIHTTYWTSAQTQNAINAATSGIPSSQTIQQIQGDITDLQNNKLDASAYTPCDLSDYWTSGETQNAIDAAVSGISGTTYTAGDNITITNNVISAVVPTIWCGTQQEYDAITVKNINTIYLIHS